MRSGIYDWGKEILTLRKAIINADYNLMVTFEDILKEYKIFNDSVFQLKKKKNTFAQSLKEEIERKYLFENICTPVDNDYIMAILNFKKKQTITLLKQKNY